MGPLTGTEKCAILDKRGERREGTVRSWNLPPLTLARSVMNLFLYAITVLIWGTTWIAIKWQLGVVPPPVSIAWRFGLAALLLFVILRLMRRPIWPRTHQRDS